MIVNMYTHDKILQLDDRPIRSIGWVLEPDFASIQVGLDGVTKINCAEQYCGEYSIWWFQVWKGTKLVARYNIRNIDTILYEE